MAPSSRIRWCLEVPTSSPSSSRVLPASRRARRMRAAISFIGAFWISRESSSVVTSDVYIPRDVPCQDCVTSANITSRECFTSRDVSQYRSLGSRLRTDAHADGAASEIRAKEPRSQQIEWLPPNQIPNARRVRRGNRSKRSVQADRLGEEGSDAARVRSRHCQAHSVSGCCVWSSWRSGAFAGVGWQPPSRTSS